MTAAPSIPATTTEPKYAVEQLDSVEALRCPCGWTKRAFIGEPNGPASVHLLQVEEDARVHYHKKMTEIYVILEGEGYLELDGDRVPLKPMTTVMIKPGCRHRAVGKLKLLNIPVPAFDHHDEWFD